MYEETKELIKYGLFALVIIAVIAAIIYGVFLLFRWAVLTMAIFLGISGWVIVALFVLLWFSRWFLAPRFIVNIPEVKKSV